MTDQKTALLLFSCVFTCNDVRQFWKSLILLPWTRTSDKRFKPIPQQTAGSGQNENKYLFFFSRSNIIVLKIESFNSENHLYQPLQNTQIPLTCLQFEQNNSLRAKFNIFQNIIRVVLSTHCLNIDGWIFFFVGNDFPPKLLKKMLKIVKYWNILLERHVTECVLSSVVVG